MPLRIITIWQAKKDIVADGDKGEREGLLTTIRARRKWYLGVYALQIFGWLILLVFNEVSDVNSTDTVSQRILDAVVIMSFIGQGTLISTILLIDVVFDGFRYIFKKGPSSWDCCLTISRTSSSSVAESRG